VTSIFTAIILYAPRASATNQLCILERTERGVNAIFKWMMIMRGNDLQSVKVQNETFAETSRAVGVRHRHDVCN